MLKKTWLHVSVIDTLLGDMLAIGDDAGLYALEFMTELEASDVIKYLERTLNARTTQQSNKIVHQIAHELRLYFRGKSFHFQTPIHLIGTEFQTSVWRALRTIPAGTTVSYQTMAAKVKRPKAVRAVANANAANRLAIVIPCHRVIQANHKLGGYKGGVSRKHWLIKHEQSLLKATQDASRAVGLSIKHVDVKRYYKNEV